MTSNSPVHVADDDDEFDWEAAVKEIDVACQTANPSTSLPNDSSSSSHFGPRNDSKHLPSNKFVKKTAPCKQSTLDCFLGKEVSIGPRPHSPVFEGNDDRMSCVEIDAVSAKSWIYPVNVPLRDYQLAITKTALFSNTLVALPTGLGKTLIAAVVIFNYFRWFPDGKIVFAAPSRPLVMQQIEACHNIVGIPQEWTIDMTGQLNPTKRARLWKTKRVFFVTPQVLEKDIQAGTCLVKNLVCLVIDEAHRALGNYSYCVAVRELMALQVELRILALTATPGSKQEAVQHIIDNLHISTLEYRNEDDSDVNPYVHNRKIELIEVALGKDAVDVNKQLLEVIRPYVARLSSFGLLQNRDYKTFSPPDLLNSRDNFRRAPPQELPQSKYGEIEAYFAGLITLYHIRKLLSSHGIRPAYEMLEEKMKHGPLARLISKNEEIRKVKSAMERSLSHGAPSPKLSKMLEVLMDHFKKKDPQNSRVIIFSNFRGSVRDIMNALTNIGHLVKATEFIGQSSGKTVKGQSQKVQQAVLEKFRVGQYNVIVATSIGEEGLDIMEVDLVICFDANVSPLRMIQRMGRTGRKHDGRVVVLACEGSELKGYMRKQANGRAIRKHMYNGGINSFSFHPSPRMIPHLFKPEVQFVELSIEQFIPHRKKVKDDKPAFTTKLNVAEASLIAKYFELPSGKSWRPSLIAFPLFQAFPSRVHTVMHSTRTNLLIDTMQCLQNLSFSRDSVEGDMCLGKCFGADTVEKEGNNEAAVPLICNDSPSTETPEKVSDSDGLPMRILKLKNHNVLDLKEQSRSRTAVNGHSCLFGSEFLSVDAYGKVIICSVPVLPPKEASYSNRASIPCNVETPCKDHKERIQGKSSPELMTSEEQCEFNVALPILNSDVQQENLDQVEIIPESPLLKNSPSNEGDCVGEAVGCLEIKPPSLQANECDNDSEMSPRLTNMMQSGIVPESPINNIEVISPMKLCSELLLTPPSRNENKTVREVPPAVEQANLENLPRNSCSRDWLLSSGEKSESVKQVRKLKRLRKLGDMERNTSLEGNKETTLNPVALDRSFCDGSPNQIHHVKGKRKQSENMRVFIEEEAEVSSGAEVSDDEQDEQGNSSYDDSFIDDRSNPTAASTQAESGRFDMMAIYRRSLLTQSPLERESNSYISVTPDCGTSTSKSSYSFPTPQNESKNKSAERNSGAFQSLMNMDSMSAARPCVTTNIPKENEANLETRKRKLSFCQPGSVPAINLEQQFSTVSDAARNKSMDQVPAENCGANSEMFHDDQFFASIDFDAVEAQAALLLKARSELPAQGQHTVQIPKPNTLNSDLQCSPSFDLGIW